MKEIGKGRGLGLATVESIANSHGGFVTVYIDPERGSKFSVVLPSDEMTEPPESLPNEGIVHSGIGHTILLIDDEATILMMTSAVL